MTIAMTMTSQWREPSRGGGSFFLKQLKECTKRKKHRAKSFTNYVKASRIIPPLRAVFDKATSKSKLNFSRLYQLHQTTNQSNKMTCTHHTRKPRHIDLNPKCLPIFSPKNHQHI